jgi:surface polysaccharide O-acyltransferase-like enzyme
MSESTRPRLLFVDALRLLALLQMVNGHTLHALLSPEVRQGGVYAGYLWFRGLVSVAFMLAAGLAFYITTVIRPGARSRAERWRRVARALEIIAIGFLLRLPLAAILTGDSNALRRGLASLAQVDVLPCIGVSLLVLELVSCVTARPALVAAICAGLTLMAAALTGWGASLPVNLLSSWLGPQGGSSFPLLPYSGYVFAGVTLGALALPLGAATVPRVTARRLALVAAGWYALSLALSRLPHTELPGVHTPSFFALKLAAVTLACAALVLALRRVRALPSLCATLTRETLGIYVFHLFVLYGFPIALSQRLGQHSTLLQGLSVSALMIVASGMFGLLWQRVKSLRLARASALGPAQ